MKKIEKAKKQDFAVINELLIKNDLPKIDQNYAPSIYFKALNIENNIVGAIGLEIYSNHGLLRSMVVDEPYRNTGIASGLLENLMDEANMLKLDSLYLLTTTADIYFDRKGFTRIDRTEIHEEVKKSSEFSSLCPLSSITMVKKLKNN